MDVIARYNKQIYKSWELFFVLVDHYPTYKVGVMLSLSDIEIRIVVWGGPIEICLSLEDVPF